MAEALLCRFLESDAEIGGLRADWTELQRSLGNSDLLLSHAWYTAWRAIFGSRGRNGVLTFRRGGRLTGIMPVMVGHHMRSPTMSVRHDYLTGDAKFLTRRSSSRFIPVRHLSPVLGLEAQTWRGGPLIDPQEAVAGYRSLVMFLRDFGGWDIAVLPLPENAVDALYTVCTELGVNARLDHLHRPMFRRSQLPPWEVFLGEKQHHFRKRYGEAVKRAARAGLIFKTFVGQVAIGQGLEVLSAVAEQSWKTGGREGEAAVVPYTRESRAFFETLCRDADAGITPLVSAIYEGEQPRAALLSIAFGNQLVTLLMFYDPTIKHVSTGRLLVKMAYEWAHEQGMSRIDFNSNNAFAENFADQREIYHNLTMFNGSLYGKAIHTLARVARLRSRPVGSGNSAGS